MPTDKLDPRDFIISRKRKKYRFALFHNSDLCFEYDEWDNTYRPDVIEIGAGNGQFSVELATRHPELQYLAVDVKGDRLQHGARTAMERGPGNIRFLRARADQIQDVLTSYSIQQIWVTFADPFPKNRSSGRRLTHPHFLEIYRQLLVAGGALYLKHDSREFFHWSLEQLVSNGWSIDELSFDLHQSALAEDYKILTTYEQRWIGEGSQINFVRAARKSS